MRHYTLPNKPTRLYPVDTNDNEGEREREGGKNEYKVSRHIEAIIVRHRDETRYLPCLRARARAHVHDSY